MKLEKCENGHFYDGDKNATCPHCLRCGPKHINSENPNSKSYKSNSSDNPETQLLFGTNEIIPKRKIDSNRNDGKSNTNCTHLKSGTVLMDRYEVGRCIGQGGFGITYDGIDKRLNLKVAIKEYFPTGYTVRNTEYSSEITITDVKQNDFIEEGKKKFLNEARALAEFYEAEGVVDVRDFFEENKTAYIVMEYLDGINLKDRLEQKVFSSDEIFRIMSPIFDALEKIHAKGIIHRDINPDNIMLLKNGKMKLMDFGAARLMNYSNQKSLSIVLKAGYAPEEQYRAKGVQGPWTDIYALCATIYKCITGITPDDSLERGYKDEIKWPSEMNINITANQEKVLKRGMAVRREDRIKNISELKAILNQNTKNNDEVEVNCFIDNNDEEEVNSVIDNDNVATSIKEKTETSVFENENIIITDEKKEKNEEPIKESFYLEPEKELVASSTMEDEYDAAYRLGESYYFGKGNPVDMKSAYENYLYAAQHGHADSMKRLGTMYELGQYLDVNYEEAIRWYKASQEHGNTEAGKCLEYLTKKNIISGIIIEVKENFTNKGEALNSLKSISRYSKPSLNTNDKTSITKKFRFGEVIHAEELSVLLKPGVVMKFDYNYKTSRIVIHNMNYSNLTICQRNNEKMILGLYKGCEVNEGDIILINIKKGILKGIQLTIVGLLK